MSEHSMHTNDENDMQNNIEEMVDIYSTPSHYEKPHRNKIAIISISAVALLLVGCGIFFGFRFFNSGSFFSGTLENNSSSDTFFQGIFVQGVDLGGKTMEQAKQELSALEPSLKDKIDISIVYEEKIWKVTEDDLDYSFDTDQVLKSAYQYGRSGTEEENSQMIESLKDTPKKYELTRTVGYARLRAKTDEISASVTIEPVNATVASFDTETGSFSYADGKDGITADAESLYNEVEALVKGVGTGTVAIPTQAIPFDVTEAQLKNHMQLIGTWSTVSTNTADGNHNMKLACEAVNGSIIDPGKVFSFNGSTGDTTTSANGYRKAVALVGGKKVPQYGGGICQVSTTIYGAAIRANMEFTEHHNHLWPSSYAPIGLDATVDYPSLDFKFKNPTDYPVYMVASMKGTKVTVSLYGYQSPDYDQVEVKSWQTETIAQPEDIYETDTTLQKGVKILDRQGNAGRRAAAQRIFYKDGQVVKTEELPSCYYRPIATIYKIAPDTPHNVPVSTDGKPPVSSTPESSTPSSSAPESSAPSSSAPESSQPESSAPESSQPAESADTISSEPEAQQPDPTQAITPTEGAAY